MPDVTSPNGLPVIECVSSSLSFSGSILSVDEVLNLTIEEYCQIVTDASETIFQTGWNAVLEQFKTNIEPSTPGYQASIDLISG